jgi:hypothetical protein
MNKIKFIYMHSEKLKVTQVIVAQVTKKVK